MSDKTPVVPGFRLERDPLTDEWIGTSPSGFVIRGWTQRDLFEARWALWRQILHNFRVALAEVYPPDSEFPAPPQPVGVRGDPDRRPGLAGTGRRSEGATATSPVSPGPAA